MTRWRWPSLTRLVGLLGLVLVCGASTALALQVGDKAPAFALPSTTVEELKLADYLGKKPVVLFFIIGAFTKT